MTLVSPPTSTPPPPHESDITPLTFTDDEISKIRQQMSDDGYTVDEINEYIHDLNSSQKG